MDWHPEHYLTLVGLVGGFGAFGVGLYQYSVAQRWKRMEWIASAMKAFYEHPDVERALQMVDWNERRIMLFADQPDAARRYVRVNDDVVARALMAHSTHGPFTAVEAAIRDCFDGFLDQLAMVHQYVSAGLVSIEDVRPYLDYWVRNIARPSAGLPSARLRQLHFYIQHYQFTDVRQLIEAFGFSLLPESVSDTERLKALDSVALLRTVNDSSKYPTGAPSLE